MNLRGLYMSNLCVLYICRIDVEYVQSRVVWQISEHWDFLFIKYADATVGIGCPTPGGRRGVRPADAEA